MAEKPWEGRFNKLYVCMYIFFGISENLHRENH